jgi:hypothetical protein
MSKTLLQTIVGPLYSVTPADDQDVPVVYRTHHVSPIVNGVTPSAPSEAPQPITENPVPPS